MAGKFVLKKGSTGKFHFNLVAGNGQVIATSEAYESKASALNGIKSVQTNAPSAEIDDQTADWLRPLPSLARFAVAVAKTGQQLVGSRARGRTSSRKGHCGLLQIHSLRTPGGGLPPRGRSRATNVGSGRVGCDQFGG